MILKSYAKFQEKVTCHLENDMRKCKNWNFDGILLSEVENV